LVYNTIVDYGPKNILKNLVYNSNLWIWDTFERPSIVVVCENPFESHIVLLSKDVNVWMYPISNFWKNFTLFLHIMLKYNIRKILEKKLFHSMYKVRVLSIVVKTNVMYLCIQKHKYIPKTISMIFNVYESWRYIEPCRFT